MIGAEDRIGGDARRIVIGKSGQQAWADDSEQCREPGSGTAFEDAHCRDRRIR